jgi:SAM-dependent methyltransferase
MAVLAHNAKAAAAWDLAGLAYEKVALHLGDAIDHTLGRLAPQAGDRLLDVATGTGLAARRAAARGASVVGIDLGSDLIRSARGLAGQERLAIDFRVGDAEALPFSPGSFDRVISTFGVMFVSNPAQAAAELARVCRPGGRLALASWLPDSTVARKFELHRKYLPSAAPGESPFDWGRPERVGELLGSSFDLGFETGTSWLRLPGSQDAWDLFVQGYGPTKALAGGLGPEAREAFRREFLASYEKYRTGLGIAVPREYLVALGERRP